MSQFDKAQMREITNQAVQAFAIAFNRGPTDEEAKILAGALSRFFQEPDAPTTGLQ